MKWIGALLIVGATTWLGFLFSRRLAERPKQIRTMIVAMQMMEAEMTYSKLPLYKLFESVSEKLEQPYKSFFQSLSSELKGDVALFHKLWEREVMILLHNSVLKKVDVAILNEFGKTIGQYTIHEQQKQIQLALTYLNRQLDEAVDERDTYEKLTKSTGVLIGLFIVIVF